MYISVLDSGREDTAWLDQISFHLLNRFFGDRQTKLLFSDGKVEP
jgi:hypothetical protein